MEPFYRKNEGMLLVCQNNEAASLKVEAANAVMEQILGYRQEELTEMNFLSILSPRQAETVQEYLEYEEDAHDLYAVLRRIPELALMHKHHHEIKVNFKIVRDEARGRHQRFRIIVEDLKAAKEVEEFRQSVVNNFKGHEVLDAESGLPDAATLSKDLELAQFYEQSKGMRTCFALLRVDDFAQLEQQLGRKTAVEAMGHVARVLSRNLRTDDTVGRLSEDMIGLILLDISPESARVVLNRLRWNISSDGFTLPDGKGKKPLTVSVCLAKIGQNAGVELIGKGEKMLAETPQPNAFLEVYKA